MIRRVLSTILAVTFVAAALPPAAFAEEQTPQALTAAAPQVSILSQPVHALNLQNATQGVVLEKSSKSARQQNEPFLKTGRGKAALAAVILAASIVICYQIVQGPTPTSANAH